MSGSDAERCAKPMAKASAASCGGVSESPSRARTMNATWDLSALPLPTTAFFTFLGAYSKISSPWSAAAIMEAARAAPIEIAVRADWTKMMASTATSSGSYCLMRFARPVLTAASAPDCGILAGIEMTP